MATGVFVGRIRAAWNLPLWFHTLLLFAILLAAALFTAPCSTLTSDEGVTYMQARQLHESGEWLAPSPPAALDPDGLVSVPYDGDRGTEGKAFYAKHALYPALLSLIYGALPAAAIALSMLGTLLSALVTALIARTVLGGSERPALWMVGLGSPVFFYSFVAVAHTLATAAAALALLVVVRWVAGERRNLVATCVSLLALCALASFLRTEALFLGGGIAVALWLRGAERRHHRAELMTHLAVGLSAACGSAVAVVVDRLVKQSIIGASLPGQPSDWADLPFLQQRVQGLVTTWFGAHDTSVTGVACFTLAFVLVTVAAFAARKRDQSLVAFLWAATVPVYAVALFVAGPGLISGWALVAPVVWFALLTSIRRTASPDAATNVLLVTALVGTLGVVATQYANGGGLEWGGRYFQFLVPAVITLVIPSLRAQLTSMTPRLCSVTTIAMVVSCALVAMCGLVAIDGAHRSSDALAKGVAAKLASETALAAVVSTQVYYPQSIWAEVDTRRWLVPDEAHLQSTAARLRDYSPPGAHVLLVTVTPREDLAMFGSGFTAVDEYVPKGTGTTIITLQRQGS